MKTLLVDATFVLMPQTQTFAHFSLPLLAKINKSQ
jgi:hypothetical protein